MTTQFPVPRLPVPKPGILDIDLYVPGESNLPGGVKPIKLSSNETPLGASGKAIAAYREAAGTLERYPDGCYTISHIVISFHSSLYLRTRRSQLRYD